MSAQATKIQPQQCACNGPGGMPAVETRNDAARLMLRGLCLAGARVIAKARSAHGSDCPHSAGPTSQGFPWAPDRHKEGPMGGCRCVRVLRLALGQRDWLLCFGDMAEGPAFRLSGPYAQGAKLTYGGGFWERVEV